MNNRILVILPHPDDEAFGIAGTLAKHIDNGAYITYACLTLGEMGRNMGVPPFATRVTLPAIRKLELEASCRAIGIQDLRMLGYHDKTIEFEDQQKLADAMKSLLEEIKPSLVFTFYPGYSVHPDHDATGAAVIRAISSLPSEERPEVHCVAFSANVRDELGEPNLVVDVRPYLNTKMDSIKAHRSQFQAPELVGGNKLSDEEIASRFGSEHFWIYHFDA